jgi:hypothetical protein
MQAAASMSEEQVASTVSQRPQDASAACTHASVLYHTLLTDKHRQSQGNQDQVALQPMSSIIGGQSPTLHPWPPLTLLSMKSYSTCNGSSSRQRRMSRSPSGSRTSTTTCGSLLLASTSWGTAAALSACIRSRRAASSAACASAALRAASAAASACTKAQQRSVSGVPRTFHVDAEWTGNRILCH